jgi:two-component system, cell cycle response regulator CtrA
MQVNNNIEPSGRSRPGTETPGTDTLGIGGVVINRRARAVAGAGKLLRLTRKELAVLMLLTLRRGEILTRQDILECLYDGEIEPDIGIVGVFICNLRKKLAAAGAPDLISTVRGHGYVIRAQTDVAGAPG